MIVAPDGDRAVGMEVYGSRCPPCNAAARSVEDDFVVEELVALGDLSVDARSGYFPLFRVEKRGIDTLHLAAELRSVFRSRVSYGGLKDKRAVAIQYVTPARAEVQPTKNIERGRFSARLVGYIPRPMSRGRVMGNRFRITLRACDRGLRSNVDEVFRLAEAGLLPNYFGYQRFGGMGAPSHEIGRSLVKRDFSNAVKLILCEPRPGDDAEAMAAREALAGGRFEEGKAVLSRQQDNERLVAQRLGNDPGNFVGALRALPVRLRQLFVQAYQAYIFNRTISLALERGYDISRYESGDNWTEVKEGGVFAPEVRGTGEEGPASAVPLVQLAGYGYRDYSSRFDGLVEQVMAEEKTSPRDFYIRDMQEASAEGGFRAPHLLVRDASFDQVEDTAVLNFTLARGQYATVLLREIVKPMNPMAAGLA